MQLTNQAQPDHIVEPDDRQNRQSDPQRGRQVEAQPEEPLVRRVDGAGVGVRALEDPVRVSGRGVDFVPPAQTDESAAGDVLEVVEVCGEEEEGEDEDEDAGLRKAVSYCPWL